MSFFTKIIGLITNNSKSNNKQPSKKVIQKPKKAITENDKLKNNKEKNNKLDSSVIRKNNIIKSIRRLESREIKTYDVELIRDKKMDYESCLSMEQKRALTAINGQYLVIAGAGSGKTHTIVYRTALMIELGISPSNILMITFTRKAASEMRERIISLVKCDMTDFAVSTFHSFCTKLIMSNKDFFGMPKLNILEDSQKEKIIKDYVKTLDIKTRKGTPFPRVDRIIEMIDRESSKDIPVVSQLETREKVYEKEILATIAAFKAYKIENKLYEFDDLIEIVCQGLEKSPQFLNIIRSKYQYVIVDEYQDSNKVQRRFLTDMVGDKGNLMVVGDDYQSIYGFRGADFENILKFSDDFPRSHLIKLETNYRSSDEIISYCNKVARQFALCYDKKAQGTGKHSRLPFIQELADCKSESKYIIDLVTKLHSDGYEYQDMAILYRNRIMSAHVVEAFETSNIPYNIKNKEQSLEASSESLDEEEQSLDLRAESLEDEESLEINKKKLEDISEENTNSVTFSTIHSSKGLEWKVVIIPCMLDGLFPGGDDPDIIEEEKRLYYVGVSRAKELLYLTYPKYFYGKMGFYDKKSRFLYY